MAVPAPRNDAPGGSPVADAIAEYLSNGLQVLPCGPRAKLPNAPLLPHDAAGRATWKPLQKKVVDFQMAAAWLRRDPSMNVGIICGAISGGLAVWDVDDRPFLTWLLSQPNLVAILKTTWVVRTGSDKLHVYWRSRAAAVTSVISSDVTHARLVDLRADGTPPSGPSYVVAPPSTHPDTGRPYATLAGGPKAVRTIDDAAVLLARVVGRYDAWLKAQPGYAPPHPVGPAVSQVRRPTTEAPEQRVLPPLVGPDLDRLAARVNGANLSVKIRKAVLNGARAGEQAWATFASNSEVDFAVVAALHEIGFTFDEVEAAYASFPIGDLTYRQRASGGGHGSRYLWQTWRAALRKADERQQARGEAPGLNFVIDDVVRYQGDDPLMKLWLTIRESDEKVSATLKLTDTTNERLFCNAVYAQCPNLYPRLLPAYSGREHYTAFIDLLRKLARVEPMPVEATMTGMLRQVILELLSGSRVNRSLPVSGDDFVLGWRDDRQGRVFARPARLLADINARSPMNRVTPDKVGDVMRALGAEIRAVLVGSRRERLWVVPVQLVDRR